MTITFKKSEKYVDQKIRITKEGLGGRIFARPGGALPPSPPPEVKFLSSSALFGQGGTRRGFYRGGGGEETWSMGNYWVPAVAPEDFWFRSVLWKIESEPYGTSSSYSMAIESNSPPSGLRESIFRKGYVDGDGNYRTAGTTINSDAFEYVPSVVTVVSATNVVSATLIQPDGMPSIALAVHMKNNTLAVGGDSLGGPLVWSFDLTTSAFSGTFLDDVALVGGGEVVSVAVDGSDNIFAVKTVFVGSQIPQNVSGSIWKIEPGGSVSYLLLSSSSDNPLYYNYSGLKMILDPVTDTLPAWVAASTDDNGPGINGVTIWQVTDMATESSGTLLTDPNVNSVEFVDLRSDNQGGVWVLGRPNQPYYPTSRSVLWHVVPGTPTVVSSTIITSPDPFHYEYTVANALDTLVLSPSDLSIPVVAMLCSGSNSSIAAWYAYVPPPFGPGGLDAYVPVLLGSSVSLAPGPGVPSSSADEIEADADHPVLRIAGTYGYDDLTAMNADPSREMRQGFWKVSVASYPYVEVQTLDFRVVSGSAP